MRPLCRFAAIMTALALIPALTAAETVYKWTDDEGLTHYTQQRPVGREAVRLEPHGASGPPRRVDTDPEQAVPATSDAASPADADGPGSVDEYCAQMREQAETLAGDHDLSVRHEDGSLQPLQGEARTQRLERTREQIARHCGDGSA